MAWPETQRKEMKTSSRRVEVGAETGFASSSPNWVPAPPPDLPSVRQEALGWLPAQAPS